MANGQGRRVPASVGAHSNLRPWAKRLRSLTTRGLVGRFSRLQSGRRWRGEGEGELEEGALTGRGVPVQLAVGERDHPGDPGEAEAQAAARLSAAVEGIEQVLALRAAPIPRPLSWMDPRSTPRVGPDRDRDRPPPEGSPRARCAAGSRRGGGARRDRSRFASAVPRLAVPPRVGLHGASASGLRSRRQATNDLVGLAGPRAGLGRTRDIHQVAEDAVSPLRLAHDRAERPRGLGSVTLPGAAGHGRRSPPADCSARGRRPPRTPPGRPA